MRGDGQPQRGPWIVRHGLSGLGNKLAGDSAALPVLSTLSLLIGETAAVRLNGFFRKDHGFVDSVGNNPIPSLLTGEEIGRTLVASDINDRTSYWVARHSPTVFVERVDTVTGIGWDRARELDVRQARFVDIHRVVPDLGVFDFDTDDRSMRLRSVHPGVTIDEIVAATGFELAIDDDVPQTRLPTEHELQLIRDVIDPDDQRSLEVPSR